MVEKKSKIDKSKSKSIIHSSSQGKYELVWGAILIIIIIIALASFIFKDRVLEETTEIESTAGFQSDFERVQLAIESGDLTQCEGLEPADRSLCVKTINGEIGEAGVDEQVMKDLEEASQTSDCDSFSDPVLKQICLTEVNGAEQQSTEEEDRLMTQAYETGDSTYCDQISNVVKKQLCLNQLS